MKEYEVDIWMWTETNIDWTTKMIREVGRMGFKMFQNFKIFMSSSDDPASWKQPGGTCIGLVNIMVGWKMKGGQDTKRLGHWSYVQIAGLE
eukprot:2348640-Ditylum_brightwellii.AAC.1